jgi:hypothetical protein
MSFRTAVALVAVVLGVSAEAASARDFNRNYTTDEQTLCQPDVFRLCNDDVPDQDRIIACMEAHRASLSPPCRKVFDVGLKKLQQ